MTYTYSCDGWCVGDDQRYDDSPMLIGEFNERIFKTTEAGGHLADASIEPGDLVTLCPACVQRLLLQTPGHGPTPTA